MSELADIADELGEVVAEGGEGIGATTKEELENMVEQVADESSSEEQEAASQEGVSDALNDGRQEMMEEVRTGTLESIGNKMKQFLKYMWENKASFAKMMGAEIAKGAFFTVGMKAVEAIWKHATKKDPSPANQRALKVTSTILKEREQTNPILKDWQLWMSMHFDDRDQYGSIHVDGIDISMFQILQNKISKAREVGSESLKDMRKAIKNKGLDSINAVLSDEKKYLDKLIEINSDIKTKGGKMMADGLKLHTDELENAKKSLEI